MSSNITVKTIVYFHEKKWLTTALIVFAKIHINISRNLWKRIKHFKAYKFKFLKSLVQKNGQTIGQMFHWHCILCIMIFERWFIQNDITFVRKKFLNQNQTENDTISILFIYKWFIQFFTTSFILHLDLIYLEEIRIWWISTWKWQVSYWPRIQFISFVETISNHVKE